MFTMQLDISYEVTHESVVEWAQGLNCRVLSRLEEGPGGGNPVYTFASNEYNSLKAMAEEMFGAELDNTFLLNLIIPHIGDKNVVHFKPR